MKSKKKIPILAAVTALGLAYAGVQAAAQESPSRGSTSQRGSTAQEHGGTPEHGGSQAGTAQEQRPGHTPTAIEGTERAMPAVQQPSGPARIDVRQQAPFGAILVDHNGHALYVFSSDRQDRSTCERDCARDWPPLLTQGAPTSGGRAVQSGMLGSIRRADGSMQVTYNHMPLYTFAMDRGPGEIRGQRVRGHGGEWYLIGPNGQRIETRMSGAPSATPGATGGTTGTTPRSGTTGGGATGTTPRSSGASGAGASGGSSGTMPPSSGSSGSGGSMERGSSTPR